MNKRLTMTALAVATVLVASACGSKTDDVADAGQDPPATDAPSATDPSAPGSAPTTDAPATVAPATDPTDATDETSPDESESSVAAFAVPDADCPADASATLGDGEPIVLGVSLPLSGPLATIGEINLGMQIRIDKANAEGGINGHPIELIIKDDAYDPSRTVENVTQFIQRDQVLATLGELGTANINAAKQIHETSCTPQLWVNTGEPAMGDPVNHPWTVGGIFAFNTEVNSWISTIDTQFPDGAKVAQFTVNNDFGKSYVALMETAVEGTSHEIVETRLHDPAIASLANDVTAVLAQDPDVVIAETTGAACGKLFTALADARYDGMIIADAACSSVSSVLIPLGDAADGIRTVTYLIDPNDAAQTDDPSVQTYLADAATHAPDANIANTFIANGYIAAELVLHNLQHAADNGGISRVSLMNAAWNTRTELPLSLIPGHEYIVNGIDDAYLMEVYQLRVFDAASQSSAPVGEPVSLEGTTGVYGQ